MIPIECRSVRLLEYRREPQGSGTGLPPWRVSYGPVGRNSPLASGVIATDAEDLRELASGEGTAVNDQVSRKAVGLVFLLGHRARFDLR